MTATPSPVAEPAAAAAAPPEARPVSRGLHKAALGAIFTSHLAVDMQTSSLAVLLPPLLTSIGNGQ